MKKIGYILLKHVEKIILAICMMVLISVLATQLKSLKSVRGVIDAVRTEARTAGQQTGGKKVPAIDESVFDMLVEVREPWKPSPTLGKWKEYQSAGDVRIFGTQRKPPETLPEDYRYYLEEFGPGSLFDPPLYVMAKDNSPKLVAFESTHGYDPPYRLDIPGGTTIDPNRDPNLDPNIDPTRDPKLPKDEPGSLVRLYRINSPKLPFVFMSAMGQQGSFKVTGQRQKFINKGATIVGEYTFLRAETQKVNEWKSVSVAIVQNAAGTEIKMQPQKVVPDPDGESSYDFVYYPKGYKVSYRKKNGDTLKLGYGGKVVDYLVQAAAGQVALIELRNGEATKTSFPVSRISRSDYEIWVRKVREAAARASAPETAP